MDITKKRIIKGVILAILVIIFILLLSMVLGARRNYAKFNKELNANSTIEVAKPVFEVNGDNNILIDGINDKTYSFTVKNFNSTGKSEVDLDYVVEIVNNSQADLTFELTKDGKKVNLTNNKTGKMVLSNQAEQTDSYSLKIKYTNNSAITHDIAGNVQIKVEAVQSQN